MSYLIKTLKTYLPKRIYLLVTFHITILSGTYFFHPQSDQSYQIIQSLNKILLLKITMVLTLWYVSMTLFSILLYQELKTKLKPKFNILWDKDENKYCPKCKNILGKYQIYGEYNKTPSFHCKPCGDLIYLLKPNGDEITLKEALAEKP